MVGMSDAALGVQAGSNSGIALDDTSGTHAQNNCDIAEYTAEQFYQYAAMMKMIHLLATDAEARSQLIDAINEGISGSAVVRYLSSAANDFAAQTLQDPSMIGMATHTSSDAVSSALGLPGARPETDFDLDTINRIHDHIGRQKLKSSQYQAEKQRAMNDLREAALSYWNEIKRRYNDCGFFYAAATVSTDAAFVAGELAIGVGLGAAAIKVLRSIKFFASRLSNGKVVVTAKHDLTGGKIEREFTTEEIEKDFGKPPESHGGTNDNETNRTAGEGKPDNEDEDHDHHNERKRLSDADRQRLEDEQNNSIQETMAIGKDKRGPVHTSVIDPETGDVFHGINGGVPPNPRTPDRLPNDLHPVLQNRINQYNQGIADGTIPEPKAFPDTGVPVNGVPGHHSEIWALNQALNARKNANLPVSEDTLNDLFLSNKRISGAKSGQSIIRCPDCNSITRGANDVSGDIKFRDTE